MGPFRWLSTFWTPTVEYRDYPANEVEDIAWDATAIGSRRGFLIGFLACALLIVLLTVGAVMTGFDGRPSPPPVPRQEPQEAAALQAARQELSALRDENQTLKKQVVDAKAAAACPPCPAQAAVKEEPRDRAVAPPAAPSTKETKEVKAPPPAPRKASIPAPAAEVPRPIPSNCRRPGDCG